MIVAVILYENEITLAEMESGLPVSDRSRNFGTREWKMYNGFYAMDTDVKVIQGLDVDTMEEAAKLYPELLI